MVAMNEDDIKILNKMEELSKQIGFEPEKLNKEAILASNASIR